MTEEAPSTGSNPFARWLRGERLVRLWRGQALTQKDVARETGIPFRSYSRIERGEQFPTYEQMAAISRFFRVNQDWLWMEANHLPPDMYRFLVNTKQGEAVVRNVRRIMEQVEEEGGATNRTAMYPESETRDHHDRLRFFSSLDVAEHQAAVIRSAFPQRRSS